MSVSLRFRLTATITVLTGLLALVSTSLGSQVLRDHLVATAIDEQIARLDDDLLGGIDDFDEVALGNDSESFIFYDGEFVGNEFVGDELLSQEFVGEGIQDEPYGLEIERDENLDGLVAVEVSEPVGTQTLATEMVRLEAFEIDVMSSILTRLGPDFFDELASRFGTDHSQIVVELSSDRFARFAGPNEVTLINEPDNDATVLTTQNFDSLPFSLDLTAASIDSQLAFTTVSRQGLDYAIVANVGDGNSAIDTVESSLWFASLILVSLAALATWLLIGRTLRPVNAITNRVGQISSGNLAERVPVPPRQDEIGVLATTMNVMLNRLESSDSQRRQFVSDASHELRTPVAVLQSEAEVAKRAPETTTVDSFADVVLTETHRLAGMVEDLLSIARSDETNGMSDVAADSQLHSVVDLDEIVLLESKRSRRLPVDRSAVSAGRIPARCDEISRAVAHLLDNAARHGNSQISVGLSSSEHEVTVWVEDDGPGIALNDRAAVFERFTRLDDARNRDRGGAGLGLAVVKSVVEGSGGVVEITDSSLGGARFTLRWPPMSV